MLAIFKGQVELGRAIADEIVSFAAQTLDNDQGDLGTWPVVSSPLANASHPSLQLAQLFVASVYLYTDIYYIYTFFFYATDVSLRTFAAALKAVEENREMMVCRQVSSTGL